MLVECVLLARETFLPIRVLTIDNFKMSTSSSERGRSAELIGIDYVVDPETNRRYKKGRFLGKVSWDVFVTVCVDAPFPVQLGRLRSLLRID